jgi:hypothetical protein
MQIIRLHVYEGICIRPEVIAVMTLPPPRWFHICSAERTLTPQIPLHEQNELSVYRARIQLALLIAANRK